MQQQAYILSFILKVSESALLTQNQKEYIISTIHSKKANFQLLEQLEALLDRQQTFFGNYLKDTIEHDSLDTGKLNTLQTSLSKLKGEDSQRKEVEEDIHELQDILKNLENM